MTEKISSAAKNLVRGCIKSQLGRIILSSLLSFVSSVIYIVLALFSKKTIDIAAGEDTGNLVVLAISIIGLVLLQVICAAYMSHLKVATAGKMAVSVRKNLFTSLMSKQLSGVNEYHSGDLLNRFTSDTDVVVNTASSIIPTVVSIVSRIIAGTIAILTIDWKFAAGLIIIGITVPCVCKLIGHKYRYLHTRYQQSDGRLKSFLQESFKNLSVIKSFSSLLPTHKKLDRLQYENFSIKIKRNNLSIVYSMGMYLFFTAGYFLVLLWGAAGIKAGSVTYGSLLAFLQIISQLRAPMQNISGIAPTYYSMMSSAQRITEIDDLKEELSPLDKAVTDAIKNVFTCINAEKLSFSYGEHKILKECEFSVPRGSITAITGESGVGKSTLFRLLLGYETAEGSLSFDNKYQINSSTRSLFSYVPQGNMILSGTIRENVTLCTVNADDNAIKDAMRIAQLSDFIESLPKGLDTYIGEDGLGISDGQAQRIAIARAILCDAPVLLLDEATASLDSETEYRLLKEIKKLSDKTVLLVTHRSLPDDICDNLIHLEDGKFQNK